MMGAFFFAVPLYAFHQNQSMLVARYSAAWAAAAS
jgi:hypothetical protein